MPIFFTPSFLKDIRTSQDSRFVRRVLEHVCNDAGDFEEGRNDHRYDGIENAWIRYVSEGKTAFRLIYIRDGDSIYFYRAGVHSVEDNLVKPKALEGIELGLPPIRAVPPMPLHAAGNGLLEFGKLVKTSQKVMLSRLMSSMLHVQHNEIILISPYYSEAVLGRRAAFGSFLDRAIEENTAVALITREPPIEQLDFFQALEERGILVYFHPTLHAKLYLFEIDEANTGPYLKEIKKTAILGSANLTDMGLALDGKGGNEELCYSLPHQQFGEAKEHAYWLINQSTDFVTFRQRRTRRF